MNFQYWHPEKEKMDRAALKVFQLGAVQKTLVRALKTDFYGKRLAEAGIKGADDIRSLDHIKRIPFTTKHDLRTAFPYGMLAVGKDDVLRLHASSGTTGVPTTIYFNRNDIVSWTGLVARSIFSTGCDRRDVFQNMITYGLFTGGLGFHYGGEEIGMLVIPSGPGNTSRQFRLMRDYGTTVVHATPSFLLHVESKMREEGVARENISLKRAFAGAEPYSEDTRRRIEELLRIDVFNSYGLSEMNGPGVAFECQCKNGMHLWEDAFFAEIIDPDTLEPLPDGETGELVLTTLSREAMPILRYRTRDITAFYTEACPCGRTHRRIRRIKGRSDDMLIINGVNIFPSQIEEVVMGIREVGNNYLIVVEKEGFMDRLTVKTEISLEIFKDDDSRVLNAIRENIRRTLQTAITVNPKVELVESNSLPVSEGKAIRVMDKRPKDV
ncbi:MAG: phenylacetate--CoA ligase [Spirochaetaceae bacterium]|jgi:phenylacetate-CoA ligase|nr:phenylacetate--CoA ligase [Spirochaetaceae bacterium]